MDAKACEAVRRWASNVVDNGVNGLSSPPGALGVKFEYFEDPDGDGLVAYVVGDNIAMPGEEFKECGIMPGSYDAVGAVLVEVWQRAQKKVHDVGYYGKHDSSWVVDLHTGRERMNPW